MNPVLHLLVTPLCDRNCEHCCNKQYDLNTIPIVTPEELSNCTDVFLTGGEPFVYANPNNIAGYLKSEYPNIECVGVYTNAGPLHGYMVGDGRLSCIDTLSVSIKTPADLFLFQRMLSVPGMATHINWMTHHNRLYVFDNLTPDNTGNFEVIKREWQEEFKPTPNSIFRRL